MISFFFRSQILFYSAFSMDMEAIVILILTTFQDLIKILCKSASLLSNQFYHKTTMFHIHNFLTNQTIQLNLNYRLIK